MKASRIATAISLAGALLGSSLATANDVAEGEKLAFDRKKGNCLACHAIQGGVSPGNIGPPLIAMKARFPDRAKLEAIVWDRTVDVPESAMPAFGKMGALSKDEISKIVTYIYTK